MKTEQKNAIKKILSTILCFAIPLAVFGWLVFSIIHIVCAEHETYEKKYPLNIVMSKSCKDCEYLKKDNPFEKSRLFLGQTGYLDIKSTYDTKTLDRANVDIKEVPSLVYKRPDGTHKVYVLVRNMRMNTPDILQFVHDYNEDHGTHYEYIAETNTFINQE